MQVSRENIVSGAKVATVAGFVAFFAYFGEVGRGCGSEKLNPRECVATQICQVGKKIDSLGREEKIRENYPNYFRDAKSLIIDASGLHEQARWTNHPTGKKILLENAQVKVLKATELIEKMKIED